ncbi:Nucleotide/sugar transporter family protein [Zea mays]|uniref:Nucleotide/sugar transporter family protein n=1 Tax=Zea mays TaxID=4577 RepID=A0A1D6E5Y2_MAIZE|nr:Nucleotide/sugar transporter family protein [Zea mays]
MSAGFQLGVIGSLALSVASSVAIVICNKALISTLGFPFATTLTSWHLMVTFCTLHVAHRLHFFEPKAIDGQTVILFGLLNGTSIGLLNLSLGFNSIGFYQLTNTIQKRLKVSSTQLLYQSAPYQAGILFATGPFVDQLLTDRSVFAHKYSAPVLGFIVLSCLIAVSVNFSTFLVIGTTSPVTYQVLGHLKTCLVLSFGYTLLHDPFTLRNILGILIAIFGMALYSYFSVREGKKKSANDALPVSQMADKEAEPLLATKDNNDTKKANGLSHDC